VHLDLLRPFSLSVMYVAPEFAMIRYDKLRQVLVNRRFVLRVSYAGVLRRSECERERGKCRVRVVLPMGG